MGIISECVITDMEKEVFPGGKGISFVDQDTKRFRVLYLRDITHINGRRVRRR